MLAATRVKMSDSEKQVNKNTYDISIKRVTRKFLEVSCCSRAKQQQRNVQKSVLHVESCFFVLIRPIVVFSPFSLPLPLSITRFYILFEQTINIIQSFTFGRGLIDILVISERPFNVFLCQFKYSVIQIVRVVNKVTKDFYRKVKA